MPLHISFTGWPLVTASSSSPKKTESPPSETPKGGPIRPPGPMLKSLLWLAGPSAIVTPCAQSYINEQECSVSSLSESSVIYIDRGSLQQQAKEIINHNS